MTLPPFQYLTQDLAVMSHEQLAKRACAAGVGWIQYRSKRDDRTIVQQDALAVREVCREYGAICIINDFVEIALAIGADGVHLGAGDMPPALARQRLGSSAIIGATANTVEDIEQHLAADVSYIGIGPFRHTHTKTNHGPVLGLPGCRKLIDQVGGRVPVVVIGGVTPADVQDLLALKAAGIAACSAAHPLESQTPITQFLSACEGVNHVVNCR